MQGGRRPPHPPLASVYASMMASSCADDDRASTVRKCPGASGQGRPIECVFRLTECVFRSTGKVRRSTDRLLPQSTDRPIRPTGCGSVEGVALKQRK